MQGSENIGKVARHLSDVGFYYVTSDWSWKKMENKTGVIWGTGIYASRFYASIEQKTIKYFIDSDISKAGKKLNGKLVLHPSEISSWSEFFIYVPYNFYDEIAASLIAHGLVEDRDFTRYYSTNVLSGKKAVEDFDRCLNEMTAKVGQMEHTIVFWGGFWYYNANHKRLMDEIMRNDLIDKFAYIGEDGDSSFFENTFHIPSVSAPLVCEDRLIVTDVELSESEKQNYDKIDFLRTCEIQLMASASGLTHPAAQYEVYHVFKYFDCFISKTMPKLVISQNGVRFASIILDEVCKKYGVPIVYSHEGILPGTMAIDTFGEMGKSIPAIYDTKFMQLGVDGDDIKKAYQVWDYLYNSKYNRKKQPKTKADLLVKKNGRPTVFFAGQNDPLSHMIPYSEETAKYHSPIFKSTSEAAIFLGELCEKNNWNYIFKPHPNFIEKDMKDLLPANTTYVEFADINDIIDASDVVVTILSQTNYIAMIRSKPVVMLGYTQTKGKGCTYEVSKKDEIEQTIATAIEAGFTGEMKTAFAKHIAQVNRYYLYDDHSDRSIRYGKPCPKCIGDFFELEEMIKNTN